MTEELFLTLHRINSLSIGLIKICFHRGAAPPVVEDSASEATSSVGSSVASDQSQNTRTISAYRLKKYWSEGSTTWTYPWAAYGAIWFLTNGGLTRFSLDQ